MKSQHTTFPSLSGTLAKRSTPTLQPNFAKEPSSPSRSNPRTEMYCSKMKEKSMTDKNGQLVTRYIKNWADTTEIKGCSSLQTLYLFDSNVLRSAQLFIYRNRWR